MQVLQTLKKKGYALLLIAASVFWGSHLSGAYAQRSSMIEISTAEESVVSKTNLDRIKKYIIAQGQRCTYSNMYNNNPCFKLETVNLYLNPDLCPNGYLCNSNSDITRGDFNHLVIHTRESLYLHINFIAKVVLSDRHGNLSPQEMTKLAESVISRMLEIIDNENSQLKPDN